jgi:hypothetical protein
VFVECLGWCLAFQRLAGSAIHGCGDGLEVVAVPPREIGAFREVLAEQAVGVLIRAALDEHDRQADETALLRGERIFSAYMLGAEQKIYIITEADRTVTTILRPDEY